VPNVTGGPTPPAIAEVTVAAPDVGLDAHVFELRSWDELVAAFGTATREQPDAALLVGALATASCSLRIWAHVAAFAVEGHLPVTYVSRQGADAGGLMGYALAAPPIYEQAPDTSTRS